jgi:hypothetical protein
MPIMNIEQNSKNQLLSVFAGRHILQLSAKGLLWRDDVTIPILLLLLQFLFHNIHPIDIFEISEHRLLIS